MKEWDLWTEGYSVTGQSAPAQFHGTWAGASLKDAIQNYKNSLDGLPSMFSINVEDQTFWGCRFFDNEPAARQTFG